MLVPVDPPVPVIDLDAAMRHLGADDADEDLVASLLEAAVGEIDGPNGIGRALGQQTWELRLERPWAGCRWWREIRLPLPPLMSVDAVTYLDENGAEQTLAPSVYDVVGVGAIGGGGIVLKAASTWPTMSDGPEALRVRFTAGYDKIPAPLRAAILLRLGDLYAMSGSEAVVRSETVDGVGSVTYATGEHTGLSKAAEALVRPYRVFA